MNLTLKKEGKMFGNRIIKKDEKVPGLRWEYDNSNKIIAIYFGKKKFVILILEEMLQILKRLLKYVVHKSLMKGENLSYID